MDIFHHVAFLFSCFIIACLMWTCIFMCCIKASYITALMWCWYNDLYKNIQVHDDFSYIFIIGIIIYIKISSSMMIFHISFSFHKYRPCIINTPEPSFLISKDNKVKSKQINPVLSIFLIVLNRSWICHSSVNSMTLLFPCVIQNTNGRNRNLLLYIGLSIASWRMRRRSG